MDTYAWEAVIDLHSHILPGVDDGVRTLDEAVALARAAAAEGVTTIAATPHVRHDYPTAVERMEAGVAEVRAALAAAGVPVEVVPGGELDLEFSATFSDDELRRFSLGGGGRYVLLEFPDAGWPLALDGRLAALRALGLTALLAHPERNAEVRARPGVLAAAVEHGALVQVTAGSLEGRMGRTAQAAARRLLELGLVHVLATDAHHPELREFGFAGAVAALRDPGLARHLTEDAPAAILRGDLPARAPAPVRSRGRFGVGRLRDKLAR